MPHSAVSSELTTSDIENYYLRIIVDCLRRLLVPPDSSLEAAPRAGWDGGLYSFMRRVLTSPHGRAIYQSRKRIEPVFGQIKHNRRCERFKRRGRAAARSEWRLITATHNLLKLHSHWTQPAIA